MDSNLQRRIQRYGWDKAVENYEAGWRESLAPAQDQLLAMAKPKRGETVLDIACGTGLVTFPLSQLVGPRGRVIATDISENMVMELQKTARREAMKNIESYRADAEDMSLIQDDSVDLVTCSLGFMYFPNPDLALEEVYRVLKPGGRVVFSVWGNRKNCGWAEIFPIVDARVHSAVCPLFFRLGTGNTLAREMKAAGFSTIEEERLSTQLPYANDNAAIEAAFDGGPVALAYHRFDAETKRTAQNEYLASIKDFQHQGRYEIPGEFVVCSGVKL